MSDQQPTHTAKEFKNERVQFKIHHKPHCVVEYEVVASPSLVKEAFQKALRIVGKEITIPGFRKGKAPAEIILKRSPAEVDKKWQEVIANYAYVECSRLANIPLLRNDSTISFKMHRHSNEEAHLTLSFETPPVVPSVDPKTFKKLPIERPAVNSEKIEETIRQTQLFYAQWKHIHTRPVQEGDYIILDVDVIEEEPAQRLFSDTRFEVTDKSMAHWMKQLVIGLNIGESADGTSVPDENLKPEEKEAFKPKKVRLSVKAIEEATLPELNDAFAQQLGADNVEELKGRIEALLNKQADGYVKEQLREQVTDFLLKSHPFDLPHSVIERETQFRMQQLMQDPQFKQNWNTMGEEEKRNTVTTIMAQAEKAVRMFYLCRKIIADAGITITGKDIPVGPTDPLEMMLNPSGQMHDPRQPDIKQAEAFSRVLLEKAEDWVLANAQEEIEARS